MSVSDLRIKNMMNNNHPFTEKIKDDPKKCVSPTAKRSIIRIICASLMLVIGLMFFAFGVLTMRYTMFDLIMEDRLDMNPGFPSFEWWKAPEPEVLFKVYIFTVTNPDAFLNGTDDLLKVEQVGPVVYREWLRHENVIFHKHNDSMTYNVRRTLEYKEEYNEPGMLNRTILVPNMATLGAATFLQQKPFLVKLGFKMIMTRHNSSAFINTTIYNYFWNLTDPILETANNLAPFMVPTTNVGVLQNIYKNFNDTVNVRIGRKNGDASFFQIYTYNDSPVVTGFKPQRGECYADLHNSSEGALYPQFLDKKSVLYYWRKTLCRPVPLTFQKVVQKNKITGFKYVLGPSVYDRLKNLTGDCYKGMMKDVILPDGLSDLSKCFYDLPVAASNPHFYQRFGPWTSKIEGLNPVEELHESYIVVEPTMGVPMDQVARSQSNLVIQDLTFFNRFEKFSNTVVPMFWLEYSQPNLTDIIMTSMNIVVNILPVYQIYISAGFAIIGFLLIAFGIRKLIFIKEKTDEKYNGTKEALN